MSRRRVSFLVSTSYSTRIYRQTLPLTAVRALVVLACLLALFIIVALVVAGASAYRLSRLSYLERRNARLETEFAQLGRIRAELADLEDQNRRMAEMLGVELTPPPVEWTHVPFDSSLLPDWARAEGWGSHPVPYLIPVAGYAVSRGYTAEHGGIDLAAQSGTPVRASADGIVVDLGTDSVFGRYVLLKHPQAHESYYGHLTGWKVARADSVKAGQIIGTVGSSGRSSAPHLHFEIRRGGPPVDPAGFIRF